MCSTHNSDKLLNAGTRIIIEKNKEKKRHCNLPSFLWPCFFSSIFKTMPCKHEMSKQWCFNPLTAGAAHIRVFIFYQHIGYKLLNMLKIKRDINQQYLKKMKSNESGFRPPLCTNRLKWARRTSWGWWDDWDDTVLQTQDSKFEPWRSEAEHATSRSRRLPTILTFTRGWGKTFLFLSNRRDRERNPELWRERQRC